MHCGPSWLKVFQRVSKYYRIFLLLSPLVLTLALALPTAAQAHSATAQAPPSPTVDFIDKLDPDRRLGFIERQINKQALARGYELTAGELWLAAQHPFHLLTVHEISLDSYFVSSELCEIPGAQRSTTSRGRNMAETDALRHFIASALLAYQIGPQLAERFLVAHEISKEQWRRSSQMDIYNNALGMDYGVLLAEQEGGQRLSPAELQHLVSTEALERLERGELSVLVGETKGRCGRPKLYPNRLSESVPQSYLRYQWRWQGMPR